MARNFYFAWFQFTIQFIVLVGEISYAIKYEVEYSIKFWKE